MPFFSYPPLFQYPPLFENWRVSTQLYLRLLYSMFNCVQVVRSAETRIHWSTTKLETGGTPTPALCASVWMRVSCYLQAKQSILLWSYDERCFSWFLKQYMLYSCKEKFIAVIDILLYVHAETMLLSTCLFINPLLPSTPSCDVHFKS